VVGFAGDGGLNLLDMANAALLQVTQTDLTSDALSAVFSVDNAPESALVGFVQSENGVALTSVWPARAPGQTVLLLPKGVTPRQDHVKGFLLNGSQYFVMAAEVPSTSDPSKPERRLFLGFCPRSTDGGPCIAPRLLATTVLLDVSEQSGLIVTSSVLFVVENDGYRRINIMGLMQRAVETCGEF
jgi:hypothetical protein